MSVLIFMGGLWAVLAGTDATVCNPGGPCAVCKSCKDFTCKVLRYVVDSTAGDVVQLVRTLPCRWLESHTVTAEPHNQFPHTALQTLCHRHRGRRQKPFQYSHLRLFCSLKTPQSHNLDLARVTMDFPNLSFRQWAGWSLAGCDSLEILPPVVVYLLRRSLWLSCSL